MIDSKRGSMPFALIAVAILLLASVSGMVMVERMHSEYEITSAKNAAEAMDASLEDITAYVNQELGVMILDISTDSSLGSIDDRAKEFTERAYSWLDDTFPMASRGVTAKLVDRSLELTAETMGIVGHEDAVDGYVPAYLHGIGSFKVEASSSYGGTVRELPVSTDGSYALPLAVEQGSIFERMVEEGGISISQMVSYQLESLAQYRVLNGYGMQSEFGSKGTRSIITVKDVQKAYANALDVIGTMCFRDSDGNVVPDSMDLADSIYGKSVTIDRSAFYGQVLMSVIDDIVLKWFDYLCGNFLIEMLDKHINSYKLALHTLICFFTGEDPFSAEGYIVKVMESSGIDQALYRYPGSGTTTLTVGDYTVTVDNPVADVMAQEWIQRFNVHYTMDRSYIQDTLRQILNTAAEKVYRGGMPALTIRTDPYDDTSFIQSVASAFRGSLSGFETLLDSTTLRTINSERFYDPFYASIAQTVMAHADELMDCDTLRNRIEEALISAADPEVDDLDELLASEQIDYAVQSYISAFYSDIEVYNNLRYIDGGGPSILTKILSEIASFGLKASGITSCIGDRAEVLLDEILDSMETNPYTGPISMPGTDCFLLVDGDGNRTAEKLDFRYDSGPAVSQPVILPNKCTHMTGFYEDSSAGYSTTFQFRIRDAVHYHADSTSAFSQVMGTGVTAAAEGTILNDMTIEITVGSAWALVGVNYIASNTLFGDALGVLSKALEPIMEPLRKIVEAVKEIIVAINSYIMEIARYVSDKLTEMYEKVIRPVTEIAEWIENELTQLFGDEILQLYYSLNLSEQRISFEYLGYTFEMKFDLASITSNVKTLFIASLSGPVAGLQLESSLTAKVKGEMNPNNVFVTGKATVSSDDWKVKVSLDPLMKSSKHLLTVSADVRDVSITAILPDLDDYHELGLALSSIPGLGEALSCIPIPGLGVNIGLDAGFSLKYSAPMASGLIINEFEANPKGNDKGNEWVELLNNSGQSIDLDGYTLIASSDRNSKVMKLSGTISPGEYLVIYPTFSMVNTSGKLTKNGEGLTLKDPNGDVVDKTGIVKDNEDNSKTWQRTYDGSGEWVFKDGTMGRSNGTYVSTQLLTIDLGKEVVYQSVQAAFDKVGSITDLESLQEIVRIAVKGAVERLIKHVAGCLVEASVFVKVDIMDPTSTAATGVRVALRCDSDLVEDVLKYIAGKIESVALSMKNPYKIDSVGMFTDNIDLEVTVDGKLQYPKILRMQADVLPKVDFGVTFRANISALMKVFGKEVGTPAVECGIRVIDCPLELIPSKLSPKRGMDHDMWLIKMTVEWD